MAKDRSKSQRVPIRYMIKSIELVESEFFVEENYIITEPKNLEFSIKVIYNFDSKDGNLEIELHYTFNEGDKPLHKIVTKNIYKVLKASINNLKDEVIKKKFLITITELSLNHSRGIHSHILKGSFMSKFPMSMIESSNIEKIIQSREDETT